ncbi:hypothetical protein [Actinomadura rubrisoli]|uniref:Uncharacterized protein n=1 Tax=Actinomadura rubrisoli TaxID=2530368 RepID=A0A4R5ABX0_9ACTN|nr:hypothetical protein [Actinomadura rubrisoli]TDD69195.1 hypothetical protein E1298_37730 [Actinomadura rubrisoli]
MTAPRNPSEPSSASSVPSTSPAPSASSGESAARPRMGIVRPVLWLLLVITAAGAMASFSEGAAVLVGAAFGIPALACGGALIVQHYRNRRP